MVERSRGAHRRCRRAPLWVLLSTSGCLLLITPRGLFWRRHAQAGEPSHAQSNDFPAASVAGLTGLWQVGRVNGSRLAVSLDEVAARVAPEIFAAADGGAPLHVSALIPLRIVPRTPSFKALQRPSTLPLAPDGSLHMERPSFVSKEDPLSPACLHTRDPHLGRASFTGLGGWTVEAVVLFLQNPHFGSQWQTVIGRNGARRSPLRSARPVSSLHATCVSLVRRLRYGGVE